MSRSLNRRLAVALALASLCACTAPALAQDTWPSRPIRLVLPFSAGGPADVVSRLVAQGLARQLNQSVIVDNKPGAGGIIGSDAVAKSAPDGYTLLVAGNGLVANALLRSKMPHAETDLVPVVGTHTTPSIIVTSASSGVGSLKELQAHAKRKGGINFGTAGAGSTGHFIAEMMRAELGVPVTVVHYKSGSETVNAMISGQVDLASEAPVGVKPHIVAGKLRALAATGEKRSAQLPDVPTTTEAGFPNIRIQHWGGIFAPKGTPEAILDRIATALQWSTQGDAEVRARFEATGNEPTAGSRAEFEKSVQAEKVRLRQLVARSRMSLE